MSHKIESVDGRIHVHIGTTPVADIYRHIEVMTPDEARAFVADVTAAIESIAPVRIDRWLTQADIVRDELASEVKRLKAALVAIARAGGNLPDDRLTNRSGPNDAAHRGIIYCNARDIALHALGIDLETLWRL